MTIKIVLLVMMYIGAAFSAGYVYGRIVESKRRR